MSSKPRLCACLRACARSRVVLSSSTVTRRPRSAIRSIVLLLALHPPLRSAAERGRGTARSAVEGAFYTRRRRPLHHAAHGPPPPLHGGGHIESSPRPALPHAELERG